MTPPRPLFRRSPAQLLVPEPPSPIRDNRDAPEPTETAAWIWRWCLEPLDLASFRGVNTHAETSIPQDSTP